MSKQLQMYRKDSFANAYGDRKDSFANAYGENKYI